VTKKNLSEELTMLPPIPIGWQTQLEDEVRQPYFHELQQFLEADRKNFEIYPPEEDIFRALELTPYNDVKVLLLGQDPYPNPNQGHGLCFSVRQNVKPIPGSLRNIYKELLTDVPGFRVPNNGCLEPWAKQGILMLNAVLTVRAHKANSHKDHGWEKFTDAIITKVAEKTDRVVFVFWGDYARKKKALIIQKQHVIVEAGHPSPLSARFFLGQKSFSQINRALIEVNKAEIDWQIPDV
jgi:uracil-DNA glycosylase